MVICSFSVGNHTIAAVLDAVLRIGEMTAAFLTQGVQRAVTEETVKGLLVCYLMAREKLTFPVGKKLVMLFILILVHVLLPYLLPALSVFCLVLLFP